MAGGAIGGMGWAVTVGGAVAGVAGELAGIRVERGHRVVHGRRGLAEPDRDQPHLAGVFGDVPRGVDPFPAGRHRRADDRQRSATSRPHEWSALMSAVKPSAAMTACAASWLVARLLLSRMFTTSIRPPARGPRRPPRRDHRHGQASTCRTVPRRAERGAPVHIVTERAAGTT